jgi:mono/diheme cytochrome c family protein
MSNGQGWFVFLVGFCLTSIAVGAERPDWSEGARITTPRTNPYGLADAELADDRREGLLHALEYPLDISGVIIPWRPMQRFLDERSPNPIRALLQSVFGGLSRIKSSDDLFKLAGLNEYPRSSAEGADEIPHRGPNYPSTRMGVTILDRDGVEAFTLSCAACHSANLFGKKILGMTNRFPRANDFFHFGKQGLRIVPVDVYSDVLKTTAGESALYARARDRIRSVGVKEPQTLGLDTSLAQIAISLSYRGDDPYAEFDPARQKSPKPEPLTKVVADGKPAVWWNTKYKNRWLSDDSIVSGNPIYTNILWNEIGRGTDLHELEAWFEANSKIIEELTTAVFSTEAPKFTDFFPPERIQIERAKHGEGLFNVTCARCHGVYTKAWNDPASVGKPLVELLQTTAVHYAEETRVIDVGTDPQRAAGISSIEKDLNPLAISQKNGIVVKTQSGYVPPPLVGIWARYPYFHNNSAPNLAAVLTTANGRPVTYWAGEANDRDIDYDSDLGGYPEGDHVPATWKRDKAYRYDTRKAGMRNTGHDEGIFLRKGAEILTANDKRDLVEFLKTL